ncbi:MAG: hypothetical protein Kow0010_14940 [Dehalococcoidia bacterium]
MRRRRLAVRGGLIGGAAAAVAFAAGLVAAAADWSAPVLIVVTAVAALAGAWLGYLALRATNASLNDVSAVAAAMTSGDLRRRVGVATGPTAQLVHDFNAMASRLQELFESMEGERARLDAVFNASTNGLVALSRARTVQYLNTTALSMLGLKLETAIGRPFIECALDYELDVLVQQAIEHGDTRSKIITFGPQRIPLRAVAVPIRGGGEWAVLLIMTDLTEVQRIDQVRRDFLSNVSHELRTPLAAIRAMIETLEIDDGANREEAREFLHRIHRQVDRLTALVTELLDLSRIESGAITLAPERVDVSALVAEAVSLAQQQIEAAGVTVVKPEVPGPTVEADRGALLRIVGNLLDNACKFGPPGSTVIIRAREEDSLVAIEVRDEGPGIAAKDLPRVFERFYKGEPSRAGEGVGLGLAIVKHLVRAHGGTVEVASEPGAGATFTVKLPRTFVGAGATRQS